MEYKRFDNTIVARIDRGEEILTELKKIALAEKIRLGHISALGAVGDFTVGVFHTAEKQYCANRFTGDWEIVSLVGNITQMNGEYYAHLHMSAGGTDGVVVGGHLNSATVSATCEMFITVLDGAVERRYDAEIGLNLFEFI
ncbi:MAG: DNA-binding protein [Oscillospiraceae bacterium]|nr:DNA-binding protein [Oscillospiraceae bacterium]